MPSPTEDLTNALYRTFDEFHSSLTEKELLHPSEERHRQKWLASSCKIFDIVNSYHAFCKICQKHFYSRSIPTDINSFFEKHLNTEYHREVRDTEFPRSREMITWEKIWVTGRCNVCQMSGLYAAVKYMKCGPVKLVEKHLCFGNLNMQTQNTEFFRKMSLLKKYCKLSIFREKFIKPLKDGNACLICCSKILWSGECVRTHLGSPKHLSRFFRLIFNRHNLSPKDLLNGFNLETVTRWIYNCVFKCPDSFEVSYELNRIECFLASSAHLNLDESADCGYYCPTTIEKLLAYQPLDFTRNNMCLLCNLPTVDAGYLDNGHFSSEYHKMKSANLTVESFENGDQYEAFCLNRSSRLQCHTGAIENFKQLKDGTHSHRLKITVDDSKQLPMRNIFLKKLKRVKKQPSLVLNTELMCEVCDVYIPASLAFNHATEFRHLYYCKRWQELEKYAADSRFFEAFQKVRNLFICMLCGVSTGKFEFFHHLKDSFHTQRFQWYCTLNNELPISSAVEVRPDFSVVCYLCDRMLLDKQSAKDFKINVKAIRDHWPCLLVNKGEEETKKSLKAIEDIETACKSCGNSQEAHKSDCPTNSLDWKGVDNAVKGVVDTYEDAIFKSVLNKTKSTIHRIEKSKAAELKGRQKAACKCEKSESQCKCGNSNGDLTQVEEVEEKQKKIENNDLENNKTDVKEKAEEKEQEVLVISGLNLPALKNSHIFGALRRFGKILSVQYGENCVEVVFAEQGVAKRVAASVNLFQNNDPPLTMTVKLKKVPEKNRGGSGSSKSKFSPMPSDMLDLLRQPDKLLQFISNLTAAATAAAESLKELKREELVCATINSAVLNVFPQCRCYPFGSRLSGLMFSDSDLDVFLDCGGMYDGMENTSPLADRTLIHQVAKLLRQKKNEISRLIIIDRARVPIVSFLHQSTGLHCDLSVKNALSVHNTLLIKFLISLDIRVKNIIIFFKYWVKHNGLHGPPFFSSYAVTMMAIFYLQQLEPPMLPTVEKLQNAFFGRRLTIAGWDCSFSENSEGLVNKSGEFPLHVILKGLFRYFANFEYDKFAISPLDGKPLPREAFFRDGKVKLPMCYKKHILNYPQPIERLVCQSIPICVFDPFDLSHVLTKSFTSTGLEMFKQYCQLSADALTEGALDVNDSNDGEAEPL